VTDHVPQPQPSPSPSPHPLTHGAGHVLPRASDLEHGVGAACRGDGELFAGGHRPRLPLLHAPGHRGFCAGALSDDCERARAQLWSCLCWHRWWQLSGRRTRCAEAAPKRIPCRIARLPFALECAFGGWLPVANPLRVCAAVGCPPPCMLLCGG
jgi:hypothetical protein